MTKRTHTISVGIAYLDTSILGIYLFIVQNKMHLDKTRQEGDTSMKGISDMK